MIYVYACLPVQLYLSVSYFGCISFFHFIFLSVYFNCFSFLSHVVYFSFSLHIDISHSLTPTPRPRSTSVRCAYKTRSTRQPVQLCSFTRIYGGYKFFSAPFTFQFAGIRQGGNICNNILFQYENKRLISIGLAACQREIKKIV